MEKNKKFLNNIILIMSSNIFTLLSGILAGLVTPKIMGVSDYGYYKIFTLYIGYIGLFHFGFIDGIYLKYGGKNYEDLEKSKFRTYSRFLFLFQMISTIIITLIALFIADKQYVFIFVAVALSLFAANITSYFQFISQITQRFKELSIVTIIKATLNIINVLLLFLYFTKGHDISFNILCIASVIISYLIVIWYIIRYKDIVFGKAQSFSQEKSAICHFFKIGFPLLIANLVSGFILTIDRQIVSMLFDAETYARYAFAYNLLSLVMAATMSISVVLYPMIRNSDVDVLKTNYTKTSSMLLLFLFLCLNAYFPLHIFIHYYLPKYIESLIIFRIIFPGLAITASISIIMHNYYKTFGKNFRFFIIGVSTLAISITANIMAYLIYRKPVAISIASVCVMLIWYILCESYLIRTLKVKWIKNFSYMIIMIIVFYFTTEIDNIYFSFAIYLLFFLLISVIYYIKILISFFRIKKL